MLLAWLLACNLILSKVRDLRKDNGGTDLRLVVGISHFRGHGR